MKPTAIKTTWLVWTDSTIHDSGIQTQSAWRWAAHGPLGSDTGVAGNAEEAVGRAYGASMVLAAPRENTHA